MPRKRSINPIIWDDPNFIKLTPYARLLFIGLFSNADDEGRLRGDPAYLKKLIFAYDKWGANWVRGVRNEVINTMRTVILYSVNGEDFIQLKKWDKHQKQRKERIQKSEFPSPESSLAVICQPECQTDDGQVNAEVKLSKEKLSKDNINTAPPKKGDIIEKLLKEEEKTPIKYDYQYLGLDIFQRTHAPKGKKAECIRIAKCYPKNCIMSALSFSADYPREELKWKMFLWKLNQTKNDNNKLEEGVEAQNPKSA